MSEIASHIIKAQEFQVVLGDQANAHKVQSGISALQHERIQHIINVILDDYSKEDFIYQFDSIELDLGALSLEQYETELPHRLETQLRAFFSYHISKNGVLKTGKKIQLANFKLEQLDHYLTHGYTQWNSSSSYAPLQLLKELLKDNKDEVRTLLLRLGRNETVRKRLIFQFKDPILEQLLTVVSPAESTYLVSYKTEMVAKQTEQPFVKMAASEFRNAIWEVLLAYLFVDSGGYFNKKTFIQYALKKTAAKFNITYLDLLRLLTQELPNIQGERSNRSEFQKILVDLEVQERQETKVENAEVLVDEALIFWLQQLDSFLKKGDFSSSAAIDLSKSALNTRIAQLLQSKNDVAISYITTWLRSPIATLRLLEFANEVVLQQLVLYCNPVYRDSAANFFTELRKHTVGLTQEQQTVISKLYKARNRLTLQIIDGKTVSEKDVIQQLVAQCFRLENGNALIFSDLLFSLSNKLPNKLRIPIDSYLSEYHEHITVSLLHGCLGEIEAFAARNEPHLWHYWFLKKLPEWSRTTKLSTQQLHIQLARHIQSAVLDKRKVKLLASFINSQGNVDDTQWLKEVKVDATTNRKRTVFFVLQHGVLPWWLPHYTIGDFNRDMGVIWNDLKSQKKLNNIIRSKQGGEVIINFLYTKNSERFWKTIDATADKKYARFIASFESFSESTLLPANILSRNQFRDLRYQMLTLLRTPSITEIRFIQVLKKWIIENKLSGNRHLIKLIETELTPTVQTSFLKTFQKEFLPVLSNDATHSNFNMYWKSGESLATFVHRYSLAEKENMLELTQGTWQTLMVIHDLHPKQFKQWLGHYPFRKLLIDEHSSSTLDTFILPHLISGQRTSYNQAKMFLFSFETELSAKQFNEVLFQFYQLLLVTWSINGFSSWTKNDWSRLVLFSITKELGKTKGLRMLWNKERETSKEKTATLSMVDTIFELVKETHKPHDSKEPLVEEKPYKKLGETMERQFLNPVYVKHAGLIIVAPYLGMLFSRLELTQNNEFVNSSSQQKAVQLLGYIASGSEETLAHELLVHKVLCGMPASEPVTFSHALTEADKKMADGMLEAITQHWTAINNTTIQGLRESFIMRDGKLEDDNEAFYLKVEQKAFDMLLDTIPWNISKIKLSWMPKILEVTWR